MVIFIYDESDRVESHVRLYEKQHAEIIASKHVKEGQTAYVVKIESMYNPTTGGEI